MAMEDSISFRGEDVDKGIGVTMKGNGGGWLELLAVQSRQDADDIVRAG
jgi:hypothetical protein